jgi:hypothetical protein
MAENLPRMEGVAVPARSSLRIRWRGVRTADLVDLTGWIALIGVSLSTWNGYEAGSPIPRPIAMICRAVLRDPIMMQAHPRPRVAERPRNNAAAS